MLRYVLLCLFISAAICQAPTFTTCAPKCADCRTDLGNTLCYACAGSTFNQANNDCSGDALPNCAIANRDGQCTTCNTGFALNTGTNECVAGSIPNCMLEYVSTPNKCIICDGTFPTDDLTACDPNKTFNSTDNCQMGTVNGQCAVCRYDNLMAAADGVCVGRYLYGCVQENGIGRCNGCDHKNGYYMKFGTLCWKD